jgi:outer membrane protein OmpA-like peptidoglycan-associated protein
MNMKARFLMGAFLALCLSFAGPAQAFVFNTPNEHVFEHPFGSLFDTRLLGIDASDSIAFNQGLAVGYSELSDRDGDQWLETNQWDFLDAELFKHKARTAGRDSLVLPEHPDDRDLEDEQRASFRDAYDRIHRAFDRGARFEAPAEAAEAQVYYDCWIAAVADGEADEAAQCRAAYEEAIAAAEAAATYALTDFEGYERDLSPMSAMAEHPRAFLVYFAFDRSELRAEGWRVVEEVLAAAAEFSDTTVRVVAHTDTSGPVDYNQALSERRANAVVGALIEGGLLRSRITSEAVGQNQPLVDTGDGVREQANRVAEIDLL